MTAKEKSNELISFFDKIQFDHSKNIAYTFYHFTIEEKKRCALICVNEFLSFQENLFITDGSLAYQYWQEVKKEIIKL